MSFAFRLRDCAYGDQVGVGDAVQVSDVPFHSLAQVSRALLGLSVLRRDA